MTIIKIVWHVGRHMVRETRTRSLRILTVACMYLVGFFQKNFKKSAFYSPCCQLIKYSQDDDQFFINGYVKIIKLILHVSLLPPFTRHISRIVLCLCVMCLMNPNLCVISFVKCVDCVLKLWINLSNFIWIIIRYDLNNKFKSKNIQINEDK